MPIECSMRIENMSTEAFGDVDYTVMRHAFDSQNDLSRLANESVFQADVASRLITAGNEVAREVPIMLAFATYCKTLKLDLVVNAKAVYELKVVTAINDAHVGQLLTYLYLLDLRHGKLINFGAVSVVSQFVNAPLTLAERRNFSVVDGAYQGESSFQSLVTELLRDWGTSLTLSLYDEALVELLGGPATVVAHLPMNRAGIALGNQRFHLARDNIAFRLSAMNGNTDGYKKQLQALLSHSPLHAIRWIHFPHHIETFTTIHRT